MKFELTKHAKRALAEREIALEWVERTLAAPELSLPDPDDATVERRFRRIPEFGGRVLRVAHPGTALVAQVSKPAVSPISKSAVHRNTRARWTFRASRIWKSATQPTWKSALRGAVRARGREHNS